jgi:hypothetical protein
VGAFFTSALADWLVPTIVRLELAKWRACEVGEDKVEQLTAFTPDVR